MRDILLATACEGPLALNDHAFELCRDFLQPQCDRFFTQVKLYGDYLADILKQPDAKAGNTLKLILPFLKARGITNAQLQEYARKTMRLAPGAEAAYKFLHTQGFPILAMASGYRQVAEAMGLRLGFDSEHILGTDADLDRYRLTPEEAEELRRLQEEIAGAAAIELPETAASLEDLADPVKQTIQRLDEIFGQKIPEMEIGAIYREVNLLGGAEKARALTDSLAKTGRALNETIYVGDSGADVEVFAAIRAGGGLGIAVNGDREAVNAAEVIVVAETVWAIALLTAIFRQWGKEGVLEVAGPEGPNKSRCLVLPENVIEPIAMGLGGHNFNLYLGTDPKREKIVQESAAMRARLRGAAIASGG
jgi:energy-converting hydrogenase A subunit R